MTRKINEVWNWGYELKTVEASLPWPSCCTDCFFFQGKCTGKLSETGDCRPRWREDKKQVIFVKQ